MIIAGVDLGVRKAALALFEDGDLVDVADLEVPVTERAKELRTLSHWCWSYLKVCDAVWIEEPLVGKNTRTSLKIAQTAGAVMTALAVDVDKIYLIEVAKWKKAVVGNGNANKEDIKNWLWMNQPGYAKSTGGDQDRTDATCIGLYGVRLHDAAAHLEDL